MAGASRREFLACTAAALGGLGGVGVWPIARARSQPAAIPVPPAADPPGRNDGRYFEWKEVAPGVQVAVRMEGGNALVLVGEAGAILVDTKNAGFGAALRREAELFGPLKLVVNTHHHFDHTGGNYAFTPDLTVAAHAKAIGRIPAQIDRLKNSVANSARADRLNVSTDPDVERVRREIKSLLLDFPADAAFLPNKALDLAPGESRTLEAGGRKLVVYYFGPAHTDNDLVVVFPEANVIHTGDLVFNGRHPFLDRFAGGTSAGWIAVLRKVAELCDEKTVVVPGHGDLTDRAGVLAQIEYFERVRAAISKAIADGKTRDDMAMFEVEPYTDKEYAAPEPRGGTFRGIYDEQTNAAPLGSGGGGGGGRAAPSARMQAT